MNLSNVRGPLADVEWRKHDVIIDGRTLPIRLIPDAGNGVEGAADDDLLYYYVPGRPLLDLDSEGFPKLSLTLLLSRQPTAADENVEPLIMGGYLDLTMTIEVPEGTVSQLESVKKADYRPVFAQAATFSLQLMETSSPQTVGAIDQAAHAALNVALDHDAAIDILQALWGESTPVKARCHLEYRTAAMTETLELVSDLSEVIGGCLDGLEAERFIRLIVPEKGGGVREVGRLIKSARRLRDITASSDPHAVLIRVGDTLICPAAAAYPTLDLRSIPISTEAIIPKTGLVKESARPNIDMTMSVTESTSRDAVGESRSIATFVSKQYDLRQKINFTGANVRNDGSNAAFTDVGGSLSSFNLPSSQPLEVHFWCRWQDITPSDMLIDLRVVIDGVPTIPERFDQGIVHLSVILSPLPAGPHTISIQARGVHAGGPPDAINLGLGDPITLTVTELGGDVAPGEAETFLSQSFAQPQVISYTGDQGPFVAVAGSPSPFYLPASQHLVARYEFCWWYKHGSSTGDPHAMGLDVRFVVDGVPTMASRVGRYEWGWRTIVVVLPSVPAGQHTISVEVRSVRLDLPPVEVHFSCREPGLGSPAMLAVHALKANYARISWEGLTHPSYTLYQSLSKPGTFVLVPVRYCITRFPPEQGERAYRPATVLYSNVSADTTVDSGATLLATLCPDIPPWILTELNQNLRHYVDGWNPTLHLINAIPANIEYPGFVGTDGGLPLQTHVERLPDSFQVELQTTINTAPLLTKILQLQGVRGITRFRLQGGPTAESVLCLDLRLIVGPQPDGPLGITRNGDQLRVTNHIERAVVITGEKLSSSGSWMADNRRLGPGETYVIDNASLVSFSIPDADPTTLEEVRNYIEDIHVNVKFINLVNFSSHALRSVLVSAQINDIPSLQHVSLAENGVGTMDFVLPLTRYLANPILQFQVTRTDTHGNETTTDWQDWALSTKGNVLSLDWEMMQ